MDLKVCIDTYRPAGFIQALRRVGIEVRGMAQHGAWTRLVVESPIELLGDVELRARSFKQCKTRVWDKHAVVLTLIYDDPDVQGSFTVGSL